MRSIHCDRCKSEIEGDHVSYSTLGKPYDVNCSVLSIPFFNREEAAGVTVLKARAYDLCKRCVESYLEWLNTTSFGVKK